MSVPVPRLLARYAAVQLFAGYGAAALLLALDRRWLDQPVATAVLLGAVVLLRITPIRLSKYSYLTQTAVPVIVGGLAVGPGPVVIALALGVPLGDVLWLQKPARAGAINAGREVLAFLAAFGAYALVLRIGGDPGLSLDAAPAVFTLVAMYFVTTRALFYFTLLVRSKLEPAEQLLILRWEIVSYLLTVIATAVVVTTLRSLTPLGWVMVLALLLGLGALTRQILEDAIAAEDLNKVHLMESSIASNVSLEASFREIERIGYRLLDWNEFRIYRCAEGGGRGCRLMHRDQTGRAPTERPNDFEQARAEALSTGRPVVVRHAARDPRVTVAARGAQSLVIHPVRFGDEILGTVEIEHAKRNFYGTKDVAALATLATQVATAVHIAELRRPLVQTVEQIDAQVRTLATATESLRRSAAALAAVAGSVRQSTGEQESFVRGGFEAIASLALASNDMAMRGARSAEASTRAADVAAENRAVITDAIARLVALRGFVAASTEDVAALGIATRRINTFIGTIRELADLTSLIALNAAIEAARAGAEGQGFAVVADEVRELAAQSLQAARDAGRLLGDIATQVASVSSGMVQGRELVDGVEQLSANAGRALDQIVTATGEAGDEARWIAETAAAQETALQGLTAQVEHLAEASARTRGETEHLANEADAAARGQVELERATRELVDVAAHLQTIAQHFAVGSTV